MSGGSSSQWRSWISWPCRGSTRPWPRERYRQALLRLVRRLEERYEKELTAEALGRAVAVYNCQRRLLRSLRERNR